MHKAWILAEPGDKLVEVEETFVSELGLIVRIVSDQNELFADAWEDLLEKIAYVIGFDIHNVATFNSV
jgi:hypothetical protein